MPDPRNPIEAVTHRDPYPFYAELVERHPFEHDGALGCWVAASAAMVEAVLASAGFAVRPAAERIPAVLAGTAAGDVFGRLVRMTDGASHCPLKQAIGEALSAIEPASVSTAARAAARRLVDRFGVAPDPTRIGEFAFRLAPETVAAFVGFRDDAIAGVAGDVADLVASFAPGATEQTIARGSAAAERLTGAVRALLSTGADRAGETLAGRLARSSGRFGDAGLEVAAANVVGLLTQSYEATAGAIANTLVALARHPDVLGRVSADASALTGVVDETLRYDSPVQNTRRWAALDVAVAGREVRQGEMVLVVLGAANRDPAANADPDRFDPWRTDRRSYTFGTGAHACPGASMAISIAAAGVGELIAAGVDLRRFGTPARYRPSANVRMPEFAATAAAGEGNG